MENEELTTYATKLVEAFDRLMEWNGIGTPPRFPEALPENVLHVPGAQAYLDLRLSTRTRLGVQAPAYL